MTEIKYFNFRTEFVTSSPPRMVKSNVLQVGINSSFALEKLPPGVSWYYINITWAPTSTEANEEIFCFSAIGRTGYVLQDYFNESIFIVSAS